MRSNMAKVRAIIAANVSSLRSRARGYCVDTVEVDKEIIRMEVLRNCTIGDRIVATVI